MGAQEFQCTGQGNTAQEAFADAVQEAKYEHGHGGYSGTIAEKSSFKIVPCEQTQEAIEATIEKCMQDEDHFCNDKWGPAAAIQVSDSYFVFFGWASS